MSRSPTVAALEFEGSFHPHQGLPTRGAGEPLKVSEEEHSLKIRQERPHSFVATSRQMAQPEQARREPRCQPFVHQAFCSRFLKYETALAQGHVRQAVTEISQDLYPLFGRLLYVKSRFRGRGRPSLSL